LRKYRKLFIFDKKQNTMPEISPELLERLTPIDFSVLQDQHTLVLIYPEDGRDEEMYQLLHEHAFDLSILQELDTHRHVIELEFTDTNDVMRLVFNKTENEYPLRRLSNTGIIRNISCGISRGTQVLMRSPAKPIDINTGGELNN